MSDGITISDADSPDASIAEPEKPGAAADLNVPPRLRLIDAAKYLFRVLTRPGSKERTLNGCLFLAATEAGSLAKVFARFRDDPRGQRILAARPSSREMLRDHAALAAAAPGSLARSYLDYLAEHGLVDLVLDAQLAAISRGFAESEEMSWFRQREAVMHDLRHLLTGYGPNRAGEMYLLCFRYAQTRHPGLPVFIALAALGVCLRSPGNIATMRQAYRRGRSSPLFDLLEWEGAMAEPLEAHRRALGLN